MFVKTVRRPGEKGTQKLLAQHGDRLVCVRYRYDPQTLKRYKTIELIVEESDWQPTDPAPADSLPPSNPLQPRRPTRSSDHSKPTDLPEPVHLLDSL